MVSVDQAELGNDLNVKINNQSIKATVVEKPFYDPKKKLASA